MKDGATLTGGAFDNPNATQHRQAKQYQKLENNALYHCFQMIFTEPREKKLNVRILPKL
jgi:hypothetical protein